MEDLAGKMLGNYRVVERIGRGGMAAVYKAYQPALERHVAIKVIHQQLTADDAQFLKRFQREARAVATLRHPNIVQVFDFGTQDDVSYMVMEYLEGHTLKAELNALAGRGETMPLAEVARIFEAVADALDYAHRQGMVHRDIKPANVMLTTKGEVILTDFGIARIVGGTQYTATGAVVGTPAYLSPEQGQGERGDERSDIYALGVVLYEMVTGKVPFDADTPLAVIFKHISDPLPPPRQFNPGIPAALEQVILKAMAKSPDDRYQTVGGMMLAVSEALVAPDAAVAGGLSPDEAPAVAEVPVVIEAPAMAEVAAIDEALAACGELAESTGEAPSANEGAKKVSREAEPGTPGDAPVRRLAEAPAPLKEAASPKGGLQFSRQTWRGIALVLFLLAFSTAACGLLFNAIPTEPSENVANPESTGFWVSRGCCLGPAFVLLFLAYVAFMTGRRQRHALHSSELLTVLGVAVGLLPILLGIALMVQPASLDPEPVVSSSNPEDRVFSSLLCLLPGFFIVGLSGIFWMFTASKRRKLD